MDHNKIENKNIADLPDYAALKKLAAALWQQDNAYQGAAIMVGAGFSRSAASSGDASRKLPLWNDLSKALAADLDSTSTADPLRLAEEYCAYFGKQGLYDLVKKEVNDTAWIPGPLYNSLLELPWSEVLTTNWDTLLERASIGVHSPVYNVVTKQEDLASARSPRIVKLHGTVNITDDMVFTQEDYRKYPQRHAAFVNFARQVFIENELCLLGFSGDDPNFLQWAGWVRDHLATNARRIYLVGALNLTSAKRKYLESINVSPIDLGVLVSDYDDHSTKHFEAIKLFLQALQNLKPKQAWEWTPTSLYRTSTTTDEFKKTHNDPDYAAMLLEKQLPALIADRESYPRWLVCPAKQRRALQDQICDPLPTPKNLAAMGTENRAKLLYEIAWRYDTTYQVLPHWLIQELLPICSPAKPCILTKQQQMEMALQVLKATRWSDDPESKSIEITVIDILERNAKHWSASIDELAYHQAILARDRFDYPTLEMLVKKIPEKTPAWKLRKASLFAELGQFDVGEAMLADAHRELLGQHRNDRNSIDIFSRLAWAHWLVRGAGALKTWPLGEFPSRYHDLKCSPWDHIEHLQEQISAALLKQHTQPEIEALFEPGHYKNNNQTATFNGALHPLLLLDGLSISAGMPLRWNGVSFLVEPATRLVQLNEVAGVYRSALAIRTSNNEGSAALKSAFSRTHIACMSGDETNDLLNQCVAAIEYWSLRFAGSKGESQHYALERLLVFIEVLARVSVRATPEQATQVFRLACIFGGRSELRHFRLFDTLKHLLEYSLKSIPESQHSEILLDALLFPLKTEINVADHFEWPNPVIRAVGKREQSTMLDRRIDEIIDAIEPCSVLSAPALIRLLPLLEQGFLTDAERNKIADNIWGSISDEDTLPETGLLKYVLLDLPRKDPVVAKRLVRQYLFEAKGSHLLDPLLLTDIVNAAQSKSVGLLPSEEQAMDYFDRLIGWRANQDTDPFDIAKQTEKQIGDLIGSALGKSIVPALPAKALTEDNFQKLQVFYTETKSPEAILAFPYFAAVQSAFVARAEGFIRQGLQQKNVNTVASASHALLKWRELAHSPTTDRLTPRLTYLIGSNRVVGLAALLWTCNQMYNKSYLSADDIESLVEILPVVFDNADYSAVAASSPEGISVSLVRAECVRLVKSILSSGHDGSSELLRVLEEAKQDALPEVRFA